MQERNSRKFPLRTEREAPDAKERGWVSKKRQNPNFENWENRFGGEQEFPKKKPTLRLVHLEKKRRLYRGGGGTSNTNQKKSKVGDWEERKNLSGEFIDQNKLIQREGGPPQNESPQKKPMLPRGGP